MNNAERRIQEVEERLESFESPEAPPQLLETLVTDIPEDLGSGEGAPPGEPGKWHRLRLLAASLAVVTVGGILGYRLLQERPLDEPPVDEHLPAAIQGVPLPVAETLDPGPMVPVEPAPLELGAPQEGGVGESGPAGGKSVDMATPEPGAEATVAATVPAAPEPPRKLELGEVVADQLERTRAELRDRLARLPDDAPGAGPAVPEPQTPEPQTPEPRIEVPKPLGQPQADLSAVSRPKPGRVPRPDPAPQAPPAETAGLDGEAQARNEKRGDQRTQRESLRALERRPAAAAEAPYLSHPPRPAPPSTGGAAEPNDAPYGDMFFQGYGTNPFVDTEDDALSTFGIDVDTASYTMARSYLRRGNLPPADAIRVEEFVNFFDYGDPPPRTHDFAVVAEGAPSPFASTARTYLLRFALKGREIADHRRKPAVLTFVVDVSGSMNRENRLGLVKRALRLLVDQLDAGDAVGLVVYGSRGQVLLAPTSDHERVLAAIDRLRPGGSTNAEEGLMLGYETARDRFRDGAINRVILCSDGVANVGATGPESILSRIADEAAAGIELTAVGFGMGNYNDVLMEQLADKGDGNYAYVDDVEAARRVFVENLTGTLQTIAGDAKVQVEFEPRVVQSYRLLGYENRDIADRDFRNDAVDAGEIGAGHQVTALYEVKLRERASEGGILATLRLRYRSKATGRIVEDSVDLRRRELAKRWGAASGGLRLAAVAAEFAERLRGSYWARDTSLAELLADARDLERLGRSDSDVAGLAELIEIAARLEREGASGEGPAGEGFER